MPVKMIKIRQNPMKLDKAKMQETWNLSTILVEILQG